MKIRSNPFLRSAALAACTLAASVSSAFAANGWWNTGDGNWDNVNNWWTTVGGTTIVGSVPTSGQTITFNGTNVNGNQIVYLNGNRAGSTLTFSNTGSTTLLGGIAGTPANDTLTLSGGITVSAGAGRVNIGVNTTATTLTLSNTDITTLSGANSFSGAITLGSGSTLKLANADAVGGTTTGITGPNGSSSTLWLANNAGINNLKINSNSGSSITTRTIVDRATAGDGTAVNHSIAFTSTRGHYIFQKGSLVTSGTPLITASGTTTFGSGTNIVAASVFNPLGVNLSFGNMSAAITGANCNNGLVLDGNSTGNKITGVISNGGSSAAALTPTITATTGSQTVTVSAASGILVGSLLSGYSGIPDQTMVMAISGSTLTLSQVTTADMTGATGNISSRVNETRLIKAGPSTWSLSGANAFTGVSTVQGGTLNLDFSAAGAPTSNILYNNYPSSVTRPNVTVAGGNLQITGKGSGGNNVQTIGTLVVSGGTSSKVTVGGGVAGSTVTLQAANLTNNTSSLLDVSGIDANNIVNAGAVTTTGNNARITTNNYTDFGYVDPTSKNIVSSGSNIFNALPTTAVGGVSSFFTLTGDVTRSTANVAFKGIRITGGNGTLDLGGLQLQASGGSNSSILYTGSGTYNISNGTITASLNTGTEVSFITASGSTLNIAASAAISNNGAGATAILTGGLGTVSVTGAKNYTGVNRILGGTYSIDTLATGGNNSGLGASTNVAANLIISGGTVKYTGSEATPTTDRSFTVGANGATLDASGTNALNWAPAVALAYTASQNNYLTLTGSNIGNNTFGGGVGVLANGGTFTTLTKTGAGKWIASGANTYTGGTYINDGTLGVAGTETAGTSGPLGASGPIVFGGGTLEYSATNAADYSKRILLSTSAISINTNSRDVTYASALDSSNTGGLTKSGTGSLTLAGTNTYTGETAVNAGTLFVTGSLASSGVTVAPAGAIGSNGLAGILGAGLSINAGGNLDLTGATLGLNSTGILNLTAESLTLGALTFDDIVGWNWAAATPGTYKLIGGDFTINWGGTTHLSEITAYDFGNGNKGYFTGGSLNAVIIPEPRAALLGGLGLLALLRRRRR